MKKKITEGSDNKSLMDSKELQGLANDFLNSRRNANNLPLLITFFEESLEQEKLSPPIIHIMEVVFTQLLKRGDLQEKQESDEVEKQYNNWLKERYEETWMLLLKALHTNRGAEALKSCMKLIAAEGKWLTNDTNSKFPNERLQQLLEEIVSVHNSKSALIQHFREYTKYLDVVSHVWRIAFKIITNELFKQEVWALNFLELIGELSVTDDLHKQALLWCPCENVASVYSYVKTKSFINKLWQKLVGWSENLPEAVLKQLLIVLLERIMPHLEKPLLLTDFLMDSLECGGVISLLALQGVFTLIQKHNVTYPHIYDKLYSLFEPEIFSTKYKARLFFLADIFLNSTHLPEALVAGFVKRLARLSLSAPPQDILIIISFISNLMVRHAGLKKLVHSNNSITVESDPFIMEESKPENSRAIESSLWEFIVLQQHVLPNVAAAARSFIQKLPTVENNLSAVLDVTENDIFDEELKKNHKQFPMNFERPKSLFLPKDDKVQQYWELF